MLRRALPVEVTARLGIPAAGSLVLRLSNAGISLGISILLARLLGPDGYGVYAFAFAVVMLLALPTQAGLPTLLVREVAHYEAAEEWGRMRGLLRWSNRAVAVLVVLIGGGAIVAILAMGERLAPEKSQTLLWALGLLPLFALGNLRGAALRGLRRVIQGQLPEFLIRPGLFALSLIALILLDETRLGVMELTPSLAMALHAGAAFLAFSVGVWQLRRVLPDSTRRSPPSYQAREWLRSLLPLTLLTGVALINSQMDIVLLGLLASTKDVGVYRVAWSASSPIVFALTAVNLVLAPHLAHAHSKGDTAALQRLATWSARVAAAVAVPAALLLIAVGGPIVGFVYGRQFMAGGTALAILAVGQLCNAAAGSVGTILNMTGNERDTLLGVGSAAVVNLILNLVLIPRLGITGAALATMTSLIIWNAILVARVRRRVGITSLAWHRRR